MNIETANRLLNLRKENNLSQEGLAEKLGISRQAVSKWERAEASPDTDNLIALAILYKISLDDLLNMSDTESEHTELEHIEEVQDEAADEKKEYVRIGLKGIHVKDDNSEVHVGWGGIHIDDKKRNEKVDVGPEGVYFNGEPYDGTYTRHHSRAKTLWGLPFVMIVAAAYLVIGAVYDVWHPTWLLFLLIPLWYTIIEAVEKRDANRFAYPVLVVIIFLLLGFYEDAWHPGWVLFITVPIYYGIVNYIRAVKSGE